uniref:Methyltransferase domain-containing protein n=1 Tax=Corethron hystrix TaxID=216773 RepID=A0A7S1BRR7_9STRA|mmetsp:Transcript_37404/g.87228  ORF Transcript_37404/g.87228 Transcript_37404/m.87228 type:complete len:391 (+) Transcript_37404:153-1325(+)
MSNNQLPLKIKAVITRRRSVGRNLAFADIIVESVEDEELGREHIANTSLKVSFRRDSSSWDTAFDDTFPTKRSLLPYGAVVKLDLWECKNESSGGELIAPKYEVMRWSILKHPREEAMNYARQEVPGSDTTEFNLLSSEFREIGTSCTKYFTSRMTQYLKYNDVPSSELRQKRNPKGPDRVLLRTRLDEDGPSSHGDKKFKTLRAKIFASFVVSKFGPELFQGNGQVLDVAGGKGQLSVELALLTQMQCTVIDPLIRGKGETQKLRSRDVKRIRKANGRLPMHLAKYFTFHNDCIERVKSSNIIVAMHPDEATEDVLMSAILNNKPAAIVPCCVFASLHPERRLKNGKEVRTYNEFIQYLMEKDERIEKTDLPFEGKNIALTFDPRKSRV